MATKNIKTSYFPCLSFCCKYCVDEILNEPKSSAERDIAQQRCNYAVTMIISTPFVPLIIFCVLASYPTRKYRAKRKKESNYSPSVIDRI